MWVWVFWKSCALCTLWTFDCFLSKNMLHCYISEFLEDKYSNPSLQEGNLFWPHQLSTHCCLFTLSHIFEWLLITQVTTSYSPLSSIWAVYRFLKESGTLDTGVSLASAITTVINHWAEVQLVALDIKGAFNHVQWDSLLEHLWSIGCCGKVFRLFQSYLSNWYIKVVTPFDSSDLHPVSAGVPQGAIWSSLLFNRYIHLLPSIPRHCYVAGYAGDLMLLTTIPHKDNSVTAAARLNADLAALCEYGQHWNIKFAPLKAFSLVISWKSDISNHPPLFLDSVQILEVSSVKILIFVFNSSFTWQKHIDNVLSCGKQQLSQLYRCRSLFGCEGIVTLYKSCIHSVLKYSHILYYRAALSHLNRLDRLQARVENMCGLTFPSLTTHYIASVLGLACHLLAGKGRSSLQPFCPKFKSILLIVSYQLHSFDPASLLHL